MTTTNPNELPHARPKILIVDDLGANLTALCDVLDEVSAELVTFQHGQDALRWLMTTPEPPALALLDVQMPEMDGYELASLIRQYPATRTLPLIFISAVFRDIDHIYQGYHAGGVDFVTKPFDNSILIAKVQVFLNLHQSRQETMAALERQMQIEVQAVNQAKLASLGEMAAGVMHEISQPLSYISSVIQTQQRMLKKGTPLPPEKLVEMLVEMLDESRHQIDRIVQIMDHLRRFSRSDEHNPAQPVVWPDILNHALIFARKNLSNKNVELVQDISPDLPMVMGNNNAFEQIMINFMQNAIHALEGREDKQIRISMQPVEKAGATWLEIRFADNGAGMPPEVKARCFEAFFTTKPEEIGTGIGLSLVHKIVTRYGGHITVDSVPGQGTAFVMQFPGV